VLRWQWERRRKRRPDTGGFQWRVARPELAFLAANRRVACATWIGHATVLVQAGGFNLLTDPQFSERASPAQWAGPRRTVPPTPSLDALPAIDAVLISHDHYDSLDAASVRALHRRNPGTIRFFVPLGLKRWFRRRGITTVTELDWWESRRFDTLEVTCVPARHWSQRGPPGRNRTLWAGWAVRAGNLRFLFAGDSAYPGHFREIGARLGPFDLAALPIGAYEPRWFMTHHMTPEEAVAAHRDLRARQSMAIHWGTFALSDEPLDEPPRRLDRARRRAGLDGRAFMVPDFGQTLRLFP